MTRYYIDMSKRMTDTLHDYIKNYYIQLIKQTDELLRHLGKIIESKTSEGINEEEYIKYSFFYLARFFSINESLQNETGGIYLKTFEAEKQVTFLLGCFINKVNLNLGDRAILRKCIEPTHSENWAYVNEFLDQIVANEELLEVYEKFKDVLSDEATLKDLIDILRTFREIFSFQIDLIYEPLRLRKSKPKRPVEALKKLEKLMQEGC